MFHKAKSPSSKKKFKKNKIFKGAQLKKSSPNKIDVFN